MHDPIRHALASPVPSLRTPFRRDGEIDRDALHRMIEVDLDGGARALMLTAGDSHYFSLSDDEIATVTRLVAEQAAGRALLIAADCQYATGQAVQFARHCADLGYGLYMALPPDWAKSTTPATLAAHYAAIAEELPVMLVTNLYGPRGHDFGFATVEAALQASDRIVAIKDDLCGEFASQLCQRFGDRCAIIAGGQKKNHLAIHADGAVGYLSTFSTFQPAVAHRYWHAIERGDLTAAEAVIRDVDAPFFELMLRQPGGFDAGIHGVMELAGLAQRWRRPPYYSLTDSELEQLATDLRDRRIPV